MQIKQQLENLVNEAISAACAAGQLSLSENVEAALERPRDVSNGDWASTVAMRSVKLAHKNPREIAQIIVNNIPKNNVIESIDIAGPGFINFKLTNFALQSVVETVRELGFNFGKHTPAPGEKQRINLEYVSANPTGPMHVGHGRWAALGCAIARIMRHAGFEVEEEYYINDHGVQMEVFAQSVSVRYLQLLGQNVQMPENCYGGRYVIDIAQGIIDADGKKWLSVSDVERTSAFREIAYAQMLKQIKATLAEFGTNFSVWFSESSLYKPGESGKTPVEEALEKMRSAGYIFEKDGATWFRSTEFGDDKDRVLVKENGDFTYFMSDMAYHLNKVNRGFDKLIDIWGADHHGYIKRCEAMLAAFGHAGKLEVVLGQLVNLFRDGAAVRMSKRTGEMVTFQELIDEVGVDATRFLMLSRSSDQPIDFDIEVAKKKDASNPVYYVQYAHARICSILRKAYAEQNGGTDGMKAAEIAGKIIPENVNLAALTHPSELALMREFDNFSELVLNAARDRAPYRIANYSTKLASAFHQFYTNCHILNEPAEVCDARLALADACRIVLALSLSLIGVSAPERM